jgi:hypothetical protein
MKSFLLILGLALPTQLASQNLVIRNIFVKMAGSSNVIQLDSAVESITAVNGGIQSDKGTGVVWQIAGSQIGQYKVPFADQQGTMIPVKFRNQEHESAKKLRFQTWRADTSEAASLGSTVSLKRLWKIDGLDRPALVELKYSDSDIPQNLLGESLLTVSRFWKGSWQLSQNTVVNPQQNTVSYTANDSASYSTTWAVVEIDIPLATNIRWIDYECNSSELVWESDLSDYTYVIYGSNDGTVFTAIDSSHTQTRFNSARVGPKYKYLKIEQKFDDQTKYESKMIKTCSIRVPLPLEIYPNPTTGRLWIENVVEPAVEVRDINGKSMLTASTSQVDIGKLINGIYFVTVQDGEISKNFKIVKI